MRSIYIPEYLEDGTLDPDWLEWCRYQDDK